METVEQILQEASPKELAVTFDIIAKLPQTTENRVVLNSIMDLLEAKEPLNFHNWIKQTKGASMRKYF